MKPIQQMFRDRKGTYRLNIWKVEEGKEKQTTNCLDFVPCGKVTNEPKGTFRWLKMRNGKMEVVDL